MIRVGKKIFSIDDISDSDVGRLFFAARNMLFERGKNIQRHSGAVLMTAFFEPSTRTRLSFEMAAHRLGMGVSTFQSSFSSIAKGESDTKTIENLLALEPDVLVLRQQTKYDLSLFSHATSSVINGGDADNEHPSQALLDCFTLLNYFQSDHLGGKHILLIGDILHSRVAHSNIKLMKRLGAKITVLSPKNFAMSLDAVEQLYSFDELDEQVDAVICLRMQKERMTNNLCMDDQEYFKRYGLTITRFEKLGKVCALLHPGPMNLGVEISSDVASHPRSLINKQVGNGVFIRAALVDYCLS